MSLGAAVAASARPPNIIWIMADDFGYGDIGPFGQTKNLAAARPEFVARATEILRTACTENVHWPVTKTGKKKTSPTSEPAAGPDR